MKQKIHNSNFIRFVVNLIVMVVIITMANIAFAQTGYIYLHKNATDENSSPNFSFNVAGPGFNKSYSLNDQHPALFVRDIGATGTGSLYAVAGEPYPTGSRGYGVYYRAADATTWTSLPFQALRIDGGPGNSHIHVNTNGDIFYYSGSGTSTSNLDATNAVDVAFDKSGTNRVYYVNATGQAYYRPATSGTWTQVSPLTAHRIDVAPNGFLISTGVANFTNVYRTDFNGANSVNLGSPTGGQVTDVAVSDAGVVYALVNSVVYRYSNGYAAGGTWQAEITSRLSGNITGSNGGQVWAAAGGVQSNTIWSRTSSRFWIDDESVRTSSNNNNSVLIPVIPGTYSVVENATSGWSLDAIDIYDPTSNTTANVATGTTTVNVAAGEVVHLVYKNFLVQSFPVVNNCSGSAYYENFGTGTTTTLRGPLVGQTNYHHISNTTEFMNDGYYMVVTSTSQAAPGSTITFGNYNDHTTGNGRMMLVNASYDLGEFFRRRFTNLLPGTQYSFSAWILNLNNTTIKPNVRFEVNNPGDNANLSNLNTGNITTTGVSTQYQLQFTATQSSVDLILRNNNIGGSGNDLALDDIRFGLATPNQPIAQATDADCASVLQCQLLS